MAKYTLSEVWWVSWQRHLQIRYAGKPNSTSFLAFPGFYLLSEKIGKNLKETHDPVPYFNEKLLKSVERTLKRFEPHQPFERTSWGG